MKKLRLLLFALITLSSFVLPSCLGPTRYSEITYEEYIKFPRRGKVETRIAPAGGIKVWGIISIHDEDSQSWLQKWGVVCNIEEGETYTYSRYATSEYYSSRRDYVNWIGEFVWHEREYEPDCYGDLHLPPAK